MRQLFQCGIKNYEFRIKVSAAPAKFERPAVSVARPTPARFLDAICDK
jgi:hypothetical protein